MRQLLDTLLFMAIAGASAWIMGCGDDTTSVTPPEDPARPASITLNPAATELAALGDTVRLTAEVRDQRGSVMQGQPVAWASGDPLVATVGSAGLVTAVGNGAATITATAGGIEATARVTVANRDHPALIAFYETMNGAGWIENGGWLSDRPLGEWHGVTTGPDGRVTALRLAASDLAGPIPPELGRLSSLEILSLERNRLTGPIPAELGNLDRLKVLNLGVNRLSGQIPAELGNLTSLESLQMRRNALEGPIPPELSNLHSLVRLGINQNRLTGAIPTNLLELEGLRSLHFGENRGLCVSGSSGSMTWLDRLDIYVGPICNERDRAALVSLYETSGGTDWTNSGGWVGQGAIDGWYGVASDSLGRVTGLDLSDNGLAGRLPGSLAELTRLATLTIGGNADLAGPLPVSLSALSLQELNYEETGLCIPSSASFRDWLGAISSHEGTNKACPPLSDREILTALYDATGGPDWTNKLNWLTDRPLHEWHGVGLNADRRVTLLQLPANNLAGLLPPELGSLAALEQLYLYSNNLAGPIPPELGNLSQLQTLSIALNDLTGPIPPELGNLSRLESLDLDANGLTGPIPVELGDLPALSTLRLSANNLSGQLPAALGKLSGLGRLSLGWNDLSGSVPPEIGNLANLRHLNLVDNDFTGPIPPELGNLSGLESVSLSFNGLTGSIPPETGNLSSLAYLDLSFNDLTGSIPPELGTLSNLDLLSLSANGLTGSIPAELGNLSELTTASLHSNDLTGSIPPELGNLSNLRLLSLRANDLTGPIPPELGNLSSLNQLWLIDNRLSGTLPPALNGLTALTHLYLANNPDLTGPVPAGFTALAGLSDLVLHGTDLCIPEDPDLQSWFSQVAFARVLRCEGGGSSMAYLTQAVQSRAFPVPLVAGRKALLRVLVTASQATSATIPAVRATFYRNGSEIHSVDVPGTTTSIPTRIDDAESALDRSANAEIPGSVIQPGLEMVIEVDPDNTLDSALGVAKRIPETGRVQLQVEKMPALDLTFVPFLWSAGSDSSLVDVVRDIAADPQGHDMLSDTRAMLPVGELDVKAHEPVLTSTTNTLNLLRETWLIRTVEGGSGYYMGLLPEHVAGGQSGVAYLGSVAGFSVADPFVIAHELGHNVSLNHAPCGGAAGPDPAFPERNGSTGVWGYDFRNGGALIPPHARDMMSYCGPPRWVSDFSFAKAMGYRLNREVGATVAADAATKTILLWGGVDDQGNPFLEPAFVGHAPPALPQSVGEYELTGRDANGGDLFSLSFDMMEIADAEGSASFVFSLPARTDWADALQDITLSGPAGVAAMDLTTNRPMAILRDKDSGRVRAILRDADALNLISGSEAAVALPGTRPEGLFSRGIPETAQWRALYRRYGEGVRPPRSGR